MVTANNHGNNGINGISKKRRDTCERIIKALGESRGLLTVAARKAGVGYTTLWRYVNEFPSVYAALREAKESMLDVAEGQLYQSVCDGHAWAICFYLKTQGKQRGYIERQEFTGSGGGPIETREVHDFADLSDEKLDQLITEGETILREAGLGSG